MEGRSEGRKWRLVDGFRARLVQKPESDFNSKLWKWSRCWNPSRNFTYPVESSNKPSVSGDVLDTGDVSPNKTEICELRDFILVGKDTKNN